MFRLAASRRGPYTHKRVYDPVIQVLSGATDIQADRESGRPQMFRIIVADKVTSLATAQAVSSALYAREKSGEGQHIRLFMLDTMLVSFGPKVWRDLRMRRWNSMLRSFREDGPDLPDQRSFYHRRCSF